jgi:hypothetical protein
MQISKNQQWARLRDSATATVEHVEDDEVTLRLGERRIVLTADTLRAQWNCVSDPNQE